MKYIETPEVIRAADNVVRQMNSISNDHFNFEYKITDDGIEFISDSWFKFQSEGVAGTQSGSSNEGFKYGNKMPPPSSFSRYTSDTSAQFAIAKSIQQKGIKAKDYAKDFDDDRIIRDNIDIIYREFIYQTVDAAIK